MARINYEIPEPVHQALREASAQENRSQKEIIIEALEEKLEKRVSELEQGVYTHEREGNSHKG